MKRVDLVVYLNDFLDVQAIEDRSNNGLQVEGAGEVEHVALAVDACLAAFEGARLAGAQMLIVHHGLFWSDPIMVAGIHRHRLEVLLDAAISLYAVHLPLDFHGKVGNNVTLAHWLALEGSGGFGDYQGQPAGVAGTLPTELSLEAFVEQVEETLGAPVVQVWPFGRPRVRRVGIVSGGAGFLVDQAAEAGVDVYLTGEMNHGVYHRARELGLNVIFGGHYATETAGLKALGEHLAERFHLETTFVDLPTGA